MVLRPITWNVALGADHSCALNLDGGQVTCWGSNQYKQIDPSQPQTGIAAVVAPLPPGTLFAGGYRTCARNGAGIYCLGASACYHPNDWPDAGATALALGGTYANGGSGGSYDFSCALSPQGQVWCWGCNSDAQSATPAAPNVAPTAVSIGAASAVSAGPYDACAVLLDGGVTCWGYNLNGEINPSSSMLLPPTPLTGLPAASSVVLGTGHGCALTTAGEVWCWGSNPAGQRGVPNDGGFGPDPVPNLGAVAALSSNNASTCAVLADAGVRCWGLNNSSQLGISADAGSSFAPVEPTGLPAGAAQLSSGDNHTCAVLLTDEVWCWGINWWNDTNGTGNVTLPHHVLGP